MSKKRTQKTPSVPAPQGGAAAPAEKKQEAPRARTAPRSPQGMTSREKWIAALIVIFFIGFCFSSISTMKGVALTALLVTVASCLLRRNVLRDRLSLPMLAVILWVLMNGVSTQYAVSGTFALREFMKIAVGFCCFLLILAWSPKGERAGRGAAAVLEGGTALVSLISIDMISTHWISGPILAILNMFSTDYTLVSLAPIQPGTRINSMVENPNVFAGIAGLGVLLALGCAVSSREEGERRFHLVCLFLNALAFVLAFSMGASGMIALAFLVFLLLERKERRAHLFLLMVETLVLVLLCTFLIYLTSFGNWNGFQPVPLLCAVAGSALLCVAEQTIGRRLSTVLQSRGKVLAAAIAAVLGLMAAYAVLALNVTGPAALSPGAGLSRANYPAPGSYTLEVQATGPVQVLIQSQNQQDTMMHTYTELYTGDAQGACFTVPEDSLVVYYHFSASEAATLESAGYRGENGTESLKLNYRLLPGFIANRLQGLFANQNAVQRTVFFTDGLRLFRRSPIIGLGVGAFENGILSVQDFFYETKYAHNHYIETLATTGIIGLLLFVGMLGLCAAAVWKNLRRKEQADPLAPALGAALVFMAAHGAMEVVFSICYYLPVALGVLALICLCCGQELPLLPAMKKAQNWAVPVTAALLAVFTVMLSLNMWMDNKIKTGRYYDPFTALEQAATWDRFDWSSYLITYVVSSINVDYEQRPDVWVKADQYAQRLLQINSNSIPRYLSDYYFSLGEEERGMEVLEKYVDYRASDSETWQFAFDMMEAYLEDTTENYTAVLDFYQKLVDWEGSHMGTITLTDQNKLYLSFVASTLGKEIEIS